MDVLDEIIGENKEKETPTPPSEEKSSEEINIEEEARKKEEHLANLKRAIAESNEQLKKARQQLKKPDEEEEIPKIDFDDPSSKAWSKHIKDNVDPLRGEIEKEKEEIRTFALQKFLEDKPLLAKNPELVKRLIGTYEKIRTASERTQEGVILDLKKAFYAEFGDEILKSSLDDRVSEAKGAAIFSDPGVSRGSSSYPSQRDPAPRLSRDDEAVLARWGMTPEEWVKLKAKQNK